MNNRTVMPAIELIAALMICLVFYGIYYGRLRLERSVLIIAEAFLAGAVIAILLLAIPIEKVADWRPVTEGFLLAALPEKALGLIAMLYMVLRDRDELSVKNSIGYGILIGAGFSFVENVTYALAYGSDIVYLRLFSSVSMHLTSMGLMGYMVGLGVIRSRKRGLMIGLGFLIPFLLHGLFDFSILTGGLWNYSIPGHIIVPVLILEVAISRSQTLPDAGELARRGIWFEEWKLLDRQRGYQKWILSSAKHETSDAPFFRFPAGVLKNSLAVLLLGIPLFAWLRPEALSFEVNLSVTMFISLFTLLPTSLSISILSIGSINPDFFRGRLIRIPIILDWEVFEEGVPAPIHSGISYELSGRSLFLRGQLEEGKDRRIQFRFDRIESPAVGFQTVIVESGAAEGILIRVDRSVPGFHRFQRSYRMRRILWGIFYYFHFPGSEGFRKLFIKPRTITQTRRTYNPGDIVFKEGDPARRFYLVEKGSVQILRDTGSGPVALSLVQEGEIFGEMALVQGKSRSATAICMDATTLSSALTDHLESLIESNPEFASTLIRTLVRRLIHSEEAFLEKLKSIEEDHDH
ncbi:MAG: cyclic nucleotide-binding domain-containing protein [Leptospiraceae bacterium]|nr:cyclic nucleotide-binding domain-containing protein [Leptospiraceae bacterium]MCB1303891.1 cyclic nucleotide-binding domain-containing protein [Leptospiraceae bacterium]